MVSSSLPAASLFALLSWLLVKTPPLFVRLCQLSARLCPEGLCKERGHWTTPEPPGVSGCAWPFLVPAQISKNGRNKQIRNFRKQQRLKAYDNGAVGKSGLWRKTKALLRLQNRTDHLLWDWHQLTPSPPGSLQPRENPGNPEDVLFHCECSVLRSLERL